ncbi:pectin acetylesterase 5 isoform X2 [Setaria italica]|uniref:pectin acetylesterase 5 isoform X2 n=1 Tax=Setaria italica TaxID=4555 RepID=UPI000BE4BDC9|nr:pectin acetylesterase 5 isoform X2 [Setaria italica]
MAMATALRSSPLVPQHRPRFPVSAVAPWLVMLLALAALSCSSPVAVAAGSPEVVELTLLANAQEKGAVCLDGSPPGYHLRRGFGSGAHNWLIYLQGGAWCNTTQSCSERKRSSLGSSKFMRALKFSGILSNDHLENPDFYDWNIVVVRYCDGASFAGDAEGEDLDGTKLFFRGLRIWEAVIDELMGKGMDIAQQALLTGCSAGSLAALLHCDNFRGRFPQEVAVKCLSDAGFFIDVKDLSGERSMRSLINGVVHLQNVREVLPKDCLQNKDPTECFFASELIKSISTPTFILNSDYDSWQIRNVLAPSGSYPQQAWSSCKADIRNCSSTQIDVLHGFKNKLVSEMKVAEDNKNWGLFIDSCFTHCQTPFHITWHSPISPRLGDKTIAETVGDWYFGRRQDVKQIDCEYPCNPTCSSRLPTA